MTANQRRLLQAILVQPTAPFREHYVSAAIETAARRMGLRPRRDRFGNVYVGYRQRRAAPIAFTAHMDHPGFEVLQGGKHARALLLGGVDPRHLRGARVRLIADPPAGRRHPLAEPPPAVCARIGRVHTRAVPGSTRPQVEVELACEQPVEAGSFGYFDLPGFDLHRGLLHSKALDNLISCGLILGTLRRLVRRRAVADVIGVFTRAEEVGFVGAGGVIRSRVLSPGRPLVVLETSKTLPGAAIGSGPVLRVGDRMTSFDPAMDLWLAQEAASLATENRGFAYQRALMTGGACEASLYLLHGRRVGGLAIPLGNYHNMTPRGGIGAEFVSTADYDHALLFLEHLATHPPSARILKARRAELDATFTRWRARLLDSNSR